MKPIDTLLLVFRPPTNPQHNKFCCLLIVLTVTLLFGCASSPGFTQETQPALLSMRFPEKPVQIRSSHFDARPTWTRYSTYERDGFMYFTGSHLEGANYSLSVRCAVSEAMKVLTMSISQFVSTDFSRNLSGTNVVGGKIDEKISDAILSHENDLHIQGVRQKEVYYEELYSPNTGTTTYNVFVILELSREDYLKAKQRATYPTRMSNSKQPQ